MISLAKIPHTRLIMDGRGTNCCSFDYSLASSSLFYFIGLVFFGLLCGVKVSAATGGQAEQAFAVFGESIKQVQIINAKSENKSGSGSGFYIGDGSLMATNYHVVSAAVMEKEEYRLQLNIEGDVENLTILAVDVVNDLAIVAVEKPGRPLKFRETQPAKGEKMFSIGNPRNIGMTIVEGNYNGLADDYIFDRIHFAGAINAGMSGGPTIDADGLVTGINVQTGGNQIGFLVPVDKLAQLYQRLQEQQKITDAISPDTKSNTAIALEVESADDIVETEVATAENEPSAVNEELTNLDEAASKSDGASSQVEEHRYKHLQESIAEQVLSATGGIIGELLSNPWPTADMAGATVLGKIGAGFDCWGNSHEDEKTHVLTVNKGCNSRQPIYLSHRFNTGYFEYEFSLIEAEGWSSYAFYNLASQQFSSAKPSTSAGKDNVANFNCIEKNIEERGVLQQRVAFCTRPYKELKKLYDALYIGVSVSQENKALMEHFFIAGVSQSDAQLFLQNFIGQASFK